jgi:hypothetical protein
MLLLSCRHILFQLLLASEQRDYAEQAEQPSPMAINRDFIIGFGIGIIMNLVFTTYIHNKRTQRNRLDRQEKNEIACSYKE